MSVINSLIAAFLAIQPAQDADYPCQRNCVISEAGVQLIRAFEGYSPVVYKDAAGLDTIGYGHLIKPGEEFDVLTPDQAEKVLRADIQITEKAVNGSVRVALKQHQYDAQVSFTFNVGTGAFKKSTLLKKVNAQLHDVVPEQFMRWVYAGGRKITGLERRRQAEATLYKGI